MSNSFYSSIIVSSFLFMILFLGWLFKVRLFTSVHVMSMFYCYIVANILSIIDSTCSLPCVITCVVQLSTHYYVFFLVLLFFSISIISSLSSSLFMEILRLSDGFSTGPVHMHMKCIQHCLWWGRILW